MKLIIINSQLSILARLWIAFYSDRLFVEIILLSCGDILIHEYGVLVDTINSNKQLSGHLLYWQIIQWMKENRLMHNELYGFPENNHVSAV